MGAQAASPPTLPHSSKTVDWFFQWSLLGMLASGLGALFGSGELDWPTLAATSLVIGLRAIRIAGWLPFTIPARWIAVLSVIYVVFYPLDYLYVSQSFLTATVHLICFLAMAKILTANTQRDYTFVRLIAILELLAAALLSIHLNFFVWLASFVLFAIATFASGEILRHVGTQRAEAQPTRTLMKFPRRLAFLSTALFAAVLTLTGGMFFILPRTARAALQRFVPQGYHLPGFANEVTLGALGELKQNSTPVMHVRSYQDRGDGSGPRSPLAGLHWRGSALSSFDGKKWFNRQAPEERLRVDRGELILPATRHTRPGLTIGYEVQLDAIASETLVFAGTPETISIPAVVLWRSPNGSLRVPRFGSRGLRYGAYSFLQNDFAPVILPPPALPAEERTTLLELPAMDRRVALLAREWTAGQVQREDQARSIEKHLRHDYAYSLQMLDTPVADPLAHFLFGRKQGHCEYFASAMAVMLRTIGIPSRVATGFYGGVENSMTGWQVIRASDAHSWVEAWIPGQGWTTFDPTPADSSGSSTTMWGQMALLLDTGDQFWRDWVMDYDLDHQVVLASQLQAAGRGKRWSALLDQMRAEFAKLGRGDQFNAAWGSGRALAACAVMLGVFIMFGPRWLRAWRDGQRLRRVERGQVSSSDATVIYQRALAALRKRGLQKSPSSTPAEFVRQLSSPELALRMEHLTTAYNQVRFGGHRDAAPRLAQMLRELEASLAK